jgi:hypothetical protein
MTIIDDFLLKQIQYHLKTDDGDLMEYALWIKLKLFFEERTRCLLNFLIKLLNFD